MTPVQLNPVASTFLVIFYVISSVALIALIGAATYLVLTLNRKLTEYQEKIDPLLAKADHALTVIAEKADSIGGKAESLLAQSEEVAESVHEKVDRTAVAVQRTINAPIIGVNSLLAGFTRGFSTFTRLQRREPIVSIDQVGEESEQEVLSEAISAPVPSSSSSLPSGQMRTAPNPEERAARNGSDKENFQPVAAGLEKES